MQLGMRRFFEKYSIKENLVAAAVSGGADSLALVFRLQDCQKKVVALTVDHKIREESTKEALFVAEMMRQHGIEHHVLTWEGAKPTHGLEEAARQARYRLMTDFCLSHGIKYLALGHHCRDQAETFLLRLARGSGVYGLSGMLPVSVRDGMTLLRPQLDSTPEELRTYLRQKNITWIEDPMNQDEDFARVKIRKFLPQLEKIGLDERRLSDTAATLANTRAFIQNLVDEFLRGHVRFWGENLAAALSWDRLCSLPRELSLNVLGQLVQKIGKMPYQPEASEIFRILDQRADFRGCTLGNCELFLASRRLWVVPEDKNHALLSKEDWDNFVRKHPKYKNSGLPYKVRRTLKTQVKD